MMNLDNYYLHATGGHLGSYNEDNNIIQILEDGILKTNENLFMGSGAYQSDNEICLCDPTKKPLTIDKIPLISSFNEFVLYSPTLVFSRDFEVYTPEFASFANGNKTDIYDEVRHIGNISLEHLEMITFPIWPNQYNRLLDNVNNKYLTIFRDNVKIILYNYSWLSVKDLFTGEDITIPMIDKKIKEFTKTK